MRPEQTKKLERKISRAGPNETIFFSTQTKTKTNNIPILKPGPTQTKFK